MFIKLFLKSNRYFNIVRVDTPIRTHFYQFLFLIDLHSQSNLDLYPLHALIIYYIKKGVNLYFSGGNGLTPTTPSSKVWQMSYKFIRHFGMKKL